MNILVISTLGDMLLGSAIGISVVFIALACLVIIFEFIQRMSINASKKRMLKAGKKDHEVVHTSGDDVVAISVALHLFLNSVHDEESNILTIKHNDKRYSPWSSKIYGLNNFQR
ncbi:MAG: OadG family protein [Paludibacter sp.]|nr:OadG family protein [Paludibacter sp.]